MKSILLQLNNDDVPYLPRVKSLVGGKANFSINTTKVTTITEVLIRMRHKDCSCVATTSQELLQLLLPGLTKEVNTSNYGGSIIEYSGVEFLILRDLEQLMSVNEYPFLFQRYMSKFITPETWMQFPEFTWSLFAPKDTDKWIEAAYMADFMAVDIETGREDDRVITCVGFSFVRFSSRDSITEEAVTYGFSINTVVFPFDDLYNIEVAKVILQSDTGKILQNGKYDSAYLLRYGIPIRNWEGDTLNLFHSWYSELPKRLDFITSFMLRKWQYWKSEAATQDKMEYYRYNAKDCYTTALDWLALLREVPQYAITNFVKEFSLVFPCHLAEMTGLKRDAVFMDSEFERFNLSIEKQLASLRVLVGSPTYNPNSSQQTQRLWQVLGCGDIKSTDVKAQDKVAFRHPINKRIVGAIKKIREDRKMAGTYLRDEHPKTGKRKVWHGRIFFSLSPSSTDTGRLASQESQFWCGWQIQNIPRDRKDIQVKRGIVADPDFFFGECDRSQAETRDTAYLSGDTDLIRAINDVTRDFHGHNASAFFGVPYDSIVRSEFDMELDEWIHTTIDKVIRDLSKRTNHGANYNMGAQVLLDTMGIENVIRAKRLLGLPQRYTLLNVTQYLLNQFAATYKVVSGDYKKKITADVVGKRILVGPTGWTRYCFGHPDKNKRDLNAYIAHVSQSLNAMELNEAYLKVFYEVALQNHKDFRLGPQIHDSILFQYRQGREDLAYDVQRFMEKSIPVTDIFGITRDLLIPTDLKGEGVNWADLKPMRRKKLLTGALHEIQTS